MKIVDAKSTFVPEKFKAPFGFKGGFLSGLWQVVCKITTEKTYGTGVGVQSVLWSDPYIFNNNTEEAGNRYMYEITVRALELLKGKSGETPIDLIDGIYQELLSFARESTGLKENLRETFVRNALVAVDNALWQAYGKEKGVSDITKLIPDEFKTALTEKHDKLCNIPLISYGVKPEDIKSLLDNGTVLLKIKIGFDNGGKMSKEEMLAWDKARLKEIHDIAEKYRTEYTVGGNILYYMDANGRYDTIERLNELIEYSKEIGAYDRIVLLEEPFEEDNKINVSSLPVRIAADESVHSLKDVEERIALGYGAVTLKPIAKTLSETLKILKSAHEKGIPCFCADLTVCPIMVEWNKNVAARIASIPEMKIGILESNGEQNYVDWEALYGYHPMGDKPFARCKNGVYTLDEEFYKTSGGIFEYSDYYDNLIK